MRKLSIAFLLALAALAAAQETYLGLFQAGQRIGYAAFVDSKSTVDGKPAHRTDSKTVMNVGMLGSALSMTMESTSWTDAQGRPMKMYFKMSSSGRANVVDAIYGPKSVKLVIDDSGAKSVRTLPIPKGATVVDDPLNLMLEKGMVANKSMSFYVLDPTTASFIKNTVTVKGASHTAVNGKDVSAIKVEIWDPRAVTNVYVTPKGGLVKVEGPAGIEMLPETKDVALGSTPTSYKPSSDLAVSTSIAIDKPLPTSGAFTELKIQVTGHDLGRIPSDQHQTVARVGQSWTVDVHPTQLDASAGTTIANAAREQPEWLEPDLHIPSDTPTFKKLAKSIVGRERSVKPAALAIKQYVYKSMTPNFGIGVLRDASEVLKTKEGVCRDYAVLTATLMRAARIPTKLVSGLVNFEGKFYYHAWVEVWDGNRWLGIDSTVPTEQLSAGHVKLGCGSVSDAFTFAFLGNVKVQVLEAKSHG